jgi:hypothetical protein
MKKILGIMVSVSMLLTILVFSPLQSFSQNELDSKGIEPWLSMFHDQGNTAYSSHELRTPFKEGFIWERESSSSAFLGTPSFHDNIMYLPYVVDGRARRSALYAMDYRR